MRSIITLLLCLLCLGFFSCDKNPSDSKTEEEPKPVVTLNGQKYEITNTYAVWRERNKINTLFLVASSGIEFKNCENINTRNIFKTGGRKTNKDNPVVFLGSVDVANGVKLQTGVIKRYNQGTLSTRTKLNEERPPMWAYLSVQEAEKKKKSELKLPSPKEKSEILEIIELDDKNISFKFIDKERGITSDVMTAEFCPSKTPPVPMTSKITKPPAEPKIDLNNVEKMKPALPEGFAEEKWMWKAVKGASNVTFYLHRIVNEKPFKDYTARINIIPIDPPYYNSHMLYSDKCLGFSCTQHVQGGGWAIQLPHFEIMFNVKSNQLGEFQGKLYTGNLHEKILGALDLKALSTL